MSKAILSLDLLKEFDEATLFDMVNRVAFIEQGYIGDYISVRHVQTVNTQKYRNSEVDHWDFTFNQVVGPRSIKVQKEINRKDGKDLMSTCDCKFSKTRYSFPRETHLDLYKGFNDYIYFILVTGSLSFVSKFVLYETGLTDVRFSDRKLGNVRYAMNLYQKIELGEIDEEIV